MFRGCGVVVCKFDLVWCFYCIEEKGFVRGYGNGEVESGEKKVGREVFYFFYFLGYR